jgi:hypothetical protein
MLCRFRGPAPMPQHASMKNPRGTERWAATRREVAFDRPSPLALRRVHHLWHTAALTPAWLVTTPGSAGSVLLASLLPHVVPRERIGREHWPLLALSMEHLIALERLTVRHGG